jgi:hypothetical protein
MLIREILAAWGCGMIIKGKYTAAIALTLAVAAVTAPSFAERRVFDPNRQRLHVTIGDGDNISANDVSANRYRQA